MADELYRSVSLPGIRRDGTILESPNYTDGEWVRWQKGQPRKMGGYRSTSRLANGPVRSLLVDVRTATYSAHLFSQWGIQKQIFDVDGNGGALDDRTPLGFTVNPAYTWSHGRMYSSTGGAYAALLAAATPDLDDLTSDTVGSIYAGDISNAELLNPVSDGSGLVQVSGGITVMQPFLVAYGSNGQIRNSNANDFSTATGWTAGGANLANDANVAGTKIVYGAPLRGGGQAPAGLFWALDALIRMSFVGGTLIWNYDTLSNPMSILSKHAIIEHDGKFFWPGVDRFLFYNGVVQELPNDMCLDWFYDNLNYTHQNKVWGTKIPRWGELWWFYPRGTDAECNDAVIFNYRENVWYDAHIERSAGYQPQLFRFPIWAGAEDAEATQLLMVGLKLAMSAQTVAPSMVLTFLDTTGVANNMLVTGHAGIPAGATVASFTGTTVTLSAATTQNVPSGTVITFSTVTTVFVNGDLVTGGTSGATGYVVRQSAVTLNLSDVAGTFVDTEVVTGAIQGSATLTDSPVDQQLDTVYQHEFGKDKILGQDVNALRSSYTTKVFGFAVGAPFGAAPKTLDVQTRAAKFVSDFIQTEDLEVTLLGRDYPKQSDTDLDVQELTEATNVIDLRGQARILRLKVESNTIGGDYQQGAVGLVLLPGDERSTEET